MKLLIFSNNPLSYSNSNGRTLLNMLGNFNNDEILNIYINGENPAFDKAVYCKINESKIINPLKKGNYFNKQIKSAKNNDINVKKRKKTPFKCILRSILWKNGLLYKNILNFVEEFKPDAILIQCGDNDYLINLSVRVANKLKLPIFSYNSEDYIFKTWNYIQKKDKQNVLFKVFLNRLIKSYNKLYKNVKMAIYLTNSIQDLYEKKYPHHNSIVIYNSSDLQNIKKINLNGPIVYSGNLGVGRVDSIVMLSNILFNNFNLKLDVYSLTKDKIILDKIINSKSIDFHGGVSYSENINKISQAKLIIHVDGFDNYYKKDTKNSFSTKIADCLSLGIPFLVFTPASNFVSDYLINHDCAFVANSRNELIKILNLIMNDDNELCSKTNNAIHTALSNHNSTKNSQTFYQIIKDGICS